MTVETKKSFCRFCHAFCALEVDVEDNKVIEVRGDASDPIYGGYTCIKGRQLPLEHNHEERLRSSMKRMPDGTYEPISSEQALDEIAEKLKAIIDESGTRAVATYNGSHAFCNGIPLTFIRAWHAGVKSPMFFTSVTIDQPAKAIAGSRHGMWMAGTNNFADADVTMMVGTNPTVSMFGPVPPFNPSRRLNDALKRGMKLIVIDPRKSDAAKKADIHLAVKPGEDATLLSGILRVIFTEGLYDGDFLAANAEHVEELRTSVEPFNLDYVEERTGVPAGQVEAAARMFASAPKGSVGSGTGLDMGPNPNLSEHLILALNTVCGRYEREGDLVSNPGAFGPKRPFRAEAVPPSPAWGKGEPSRIRGLGEVFGEMPTAALSDEIIMEGDGQVRALISVGGNPVAAWPDQLKTLQAMEALDLNVTIDIKMSATAKTADYVIAPKVSLERPDITLLTDGWYPETYAHYTPAMVEPEFDVIEEWEFFWGLAHRMGTPININGVEIDMENKPSTDDVLDAVTANSRIPLDEIREADGGTVFRDKEKIFVEPKEPGNNARLDVGPPDLMEELSNVRDMEIVEGAGYRQGEQFTHRLISRRLREFYNSSGRDLPRSLAKYNTNPAFMNPIDAEEIGASEGDIIDITSERSTILGVVAISDDIPSGVISMSHSWGDVPALDDQVRTIGASTNRLVNNAKDFDPITGMARQTAIPVNIELSKAVIPTS